MAGYHPLTLQIAELLLDKESEGGERRPEWAPLGTPWGPGPYIYAMAVMSGAYMPGAGVVGRGATAAGALSMRWAEADGRKAASRSECRVCLYIRITELSTRGHGPPGVRRSM